MTSEQPDIKPLQNGFPALHLLSAVNPAAAGASTAVPVSIIPVFQPNMFPPGLMTLPLALNQQALLQANIAAAKANVVATSTPTNSTAVEVALHEVPNDLCRKDLDALNRAQKRTHKQMRQGEDVRDSKMWQTGLAEALTRAQPRTSKGKVYSWMHSGFPKRQRAKITEQMKKEIVQFCKNHSMLKQGEIADIFGVDRTTVTKMLKRSQENPFEQDEEYDPVKRSWAPQFELEDMLYRWISNATKNNPENQPVWSCEELLEQAEELQTITDAGNYFVPCLEWLLDFVGRFRLKRLLTDYPDQSKKDAFKKGKTLKSAGRKLLPKPVPVATSQRGGVQQTQSNEYDNSANMQMFQPNNHKIPREKMAEYTIVETPLDMPIKIEPMEVNIEELTNKEALRRELKSLERFRDQQKAIEETNKLKKDLVAKTLTERKQKAKKEAYKLEHIQKELSKLDHLLTADVNVVRAKIEESSRDFLEAQKRFERAEVEYVESKMDLHEKSDFKEQLTEHLYTIIHQNEVRKAKKLADLMKELEMEYGGEDVDLRLPELPPLTSFQQTNLHLSPKTVKTVLEQSQFKFSEDKQHSDKPEKDSETCDKNSNTIVMKPANTDNTTDNSEARTGETESVVKLENTPQDSGNAMPSFTIVEDGPISIVYDIEQDPAHSSSNKDTTMQESQKYHSDVVKSPIEQENNENSQSKVKSKWEFDGTLS